MKRIFTVILLGLLFSAAVLPAAAQDAGSLYSRYAGMPGAESVSVGKFWINLAKLIVAFGQDDAGMTDSEADIALKTLSHISSVKVLDLSGCDGKVLERFSKDADECSTEGYSLLAKVRDDGDDLRVFVRKKDGVIREMLVVSAGDDPAVIRIEGRITEEEAARYIAAAMED